MRKPEINTTINRSLGDQDICRCNRGLISILLGAATDDDMGGPIFHIDGSWAIIESMRQNRELRTGACTSLQELRYMIRGKFRMSLQARDRM